MSEMQQETVVVGERRATASIRGRVTEVGRLTSAADGIPTCRLNLAGDRLELVVIAEHDLAEKAAAYDANDIVLVHGELVQHKWKTKHGQPRSEFHLIAKEMDHD